MTDGTPDSGPTSTKGDGDQLQSPSLDVDVTEHLEWVASPDEYGWDQIALDVTCPTTVAARRDAFTCSFDFEHLYPTFPVLTEALRPADVTISGYATPGFGAQPHLWYAKGQFDIQETVAAGEWERTDERGAFTWYNRGGAAPILAITDGAVIYSSRGETEVVATTSAALRGDARRLVATDDNVARITDGSAWTSAALGTIPPGSEAHDRGYRVIGRGTAVGQETTILRQATVFESGAEIPVDELRSQFHTTMDASNDLSSTVRSTGRVGIVEASIPTSDAVPYLFGPGPGWKSPNPQVSLSFEYEAGTLTITHTSGEALTGGRLVAELPGRTEVLVSEAEEFAIADSVSIDTSGLTPGDQVDVVWMPGPKGCGYGGNETIVETFTIS